MERQSEIDCKIIQRIGVALVGVTHNCAYACRSGKKHRRLQANHLHILVDGHIGARLKLHVILLSLVDSDCRFVELLQQAHRFLRLHTVDHELRGEGEHGVARQDGGIVVPFVANRRFSTAQVSLVHNVVVEQREVMIHLYGCRLRQSLGTVTAYSVARGEQDYRAKAFAALLESVDYRFVQAFGISPCRARYCVDGISRHFDIFLKCMHRFLWFYQS